MLHCKLPASLVSTVSQLIPFLVHASLFAPGTQPPDAIIVTDIVAPPDESPVAALLYDAIKKAGFAGPVIGITSEDFARYGWNKPFEVHELLAYLLLSSPHGIF